MIDPDNVFVMVPDEWGGLAVCSVADLAKGLLEEDDFSEVLSNAGMDMVDRDPDKIFAKIDKVRALNETGDTDAYWSDT